jgi:hypothetical protein
MQETHDLNVTTSQASTLDSDGDVRWAFADIARANWPAIRKALVAHSHPQYEIWRDGERIASLVDAKTEAAVPFTATEYAPRFTFEIGPVGVGCAGLVKRP